MLRVIEGGPYLASLLIAHPKATSEMLHRLLSSHPPKKENENLWLGAARHPNSDEVLLCRMLRESPESCAAHIAQRKDLTIAVCRELLRATHIPAFHYVLTYLSENPSTPDEVLARLVRQHPRHCYYPISTRDKLPPRVVRAFRESPVFDVRAALAQRKDILPNGSRSGPPPKNKRQRAKLGVSSAAS